MERNDLSRALVAFDQNSTLVAVVELSAKDWLVAGFVAGDTTKRLKKQSADVERLLKQLLRWREEAVKAGRAIDRIAVAFEAGRDGFWLARWLRSRGIEAYVIHASSIPMPRQHRRAKTDRLDTETLMRAFLCWLRGEARHCQMAAIPTLAEEDAKRPTREHHSLVAERTRIINRMTSTMARLGIRNFNVKLVKAAARLADLRTPEGEPIPPHTLAELRRDMARLALVRSQIKAIEAARVERLKRSPQQGTHPMILMLARVMGVGVGTADLLVHEVLTRGLRDERAVSRYGGLTGSPDESGSKSRGLAMAAVSEGQRARAVVPRAHRRRPRRHSQDDDHCACPQVVGGAVALRP